MQFFNWLLSKYFAIIFQLQFLCFYSICSPDTFLIKKFGVTPHPFRQYPNKHYYLISLARYFFLNANNEY